MFDYSEERARSAGYKSYAAYLRTEHWRRIRSRKLEQADHRCEVCGSRIQLQIHHRTYDRLGNERPRDLQVLCEICHAWVHFGPFYVDDVIEVRS